MRKLLLTLFNLIVLCVFIATPSRSQEITAPNAKSWEFSGQVQIQYLASNAYKINDAETNNGFRIRRGRFQVKAKISPLIETNYQIEVADNSPKLKDAEGIVHIADHFYFRAGQFKVPVWREELRSSKKLLLIERSAVAEFLAEQRLSVRHIGIEIGGGVKDQLEWTVNLSNGAGEGGREDAGRTKGTFVNNGKMVTARLNFPVNSSIVLGGSFAMNNLGNQIGITNNRGPILAFAPDFELKSTLDTNSTLVFEGGLVLGKFSKKLVRTGSDVNFRLFDLTGCWTRQIPNASLKGISAVEFAGGLSFVDPNTAFSDNETLYLRGGPAIYLGKQTRVQLNLEIEKPSAQGLDTVVSFRSQGIFAF